MIYHAAYKLNYQSVSASAIRPIRMLDAFRQAGYEVFDLTGTSSQRRTKFRILRDQIKSGAKFDFMYSESATIPAMLGNPSHFPHMFLDAQIFRYLKNHSVSTSVFYRDLYWAYDEYLERVKPPLAQAMRAMYLYELAIYKRYADVIFVPSLEMAQEIPQLQLPNVRALPPGGEIVDLPTAPVPVSMFYVGGIGVHYRLHELVKAASEVPSARLTICTAQDRWEQNKSEYDVSAPNISVVHASGAELDVYYGDSNIAVIVVDPSHYWSFAVPVKLFEYIGRGKPIIATEGTLAAQIISENGWGWVVENSKQDIANLLKYLEANPEEVAQRTNKVLQDRPDHSWLARANAVKNALTKE